MKPIAKFDVSTVLYDAVVTVYQCYQDGIPYVHVWEYRGPMDCGSYNMSHKDWSDYDPLVIETNTSMTNMSHKDWSDYDPLVIEVLVSHDIEATAIEVRDMIENAMVEHIAR